MDRDSKFSIASAGNTSIKLTILTARIKAQLNVQVNSFTIWLKHTHNIEMCLYVCVFPYIIVYYSIYSIDLPISFRVASLALGYDWRIEGYGWNRQQNITKARTVCIFLDMSCISRICEKNGLKPYKLIIVFYRQVFFNESVSHIKLEQNTVGITWIMKDACVALLIMVKKTFITLCNAIERGDFGNIIVTGRCYSFTTGLKF